jgi:hypothetical protein
MLLIFCYYLTIGPNLGLWICTKINTWLYSTLFLFGPLDLFSEIKSYEMRGPDSFIILFKLYFIVNVRSILRFVCALQYSRLGANTRADAFRWHSDQWRLQDLCRWRSRRLRPSPSDQLVPPASSLHGKLFHDVRLMIYAVNHMVYRYQMGRFGTNRYRISILRNSTKSTNILYNWMPHLHRLCMIARISMIIAT